MDVKKEAGWMWATWMQQSHLTLSDFQRNIHYNGRTRKIVFKAKLFCYKTLLWILVYKNDDNEDQSKTY